MPEEIEDLRTQAAELGISVDNRWGKDRIREEIAKASAPRKTEPFGGKGDHDGDGRPGERLVTVRVMRDFWTSEGERIRKDTIVDVPVEAALDGVETGALSRVK